MGAENSVVGPFGRAGQAVRQPGDFASGGSPDPGAFHRQTGWSFPRMADHTPAAGYIDRMQARLWGVTTSQDERRQVVSRAPILKPSLNLCVSGKCEDEPYQNI